MYGTVGVSCQIIIHKEKDDEHLSFSLLTCKRGRITAPALLRELNELIGTKHLNSRRHTAVLSGSCAPLRATCLPCVLSAGPLGLER